MTNTPTPHRPAHLRTPLGVLARSGAALALALGLAACQTVADPTPPGALTLTGISPASGNSATTVTVTGDNIMGLAEVTVGGEAATNVVVRDALGIQVVGENRNGTQVSFNPPVLVDGTTYDVTVTQGDDESATLADAFTYSDTPVIVDPTAVYRVNAGPAAVTIGDVTWEHDLAYISGPGGGTFTTATAISGTDSDAVYQSERHTAGGTTLTYNFSVENGEYQVVLHFAEIFYGLPGDGAAGGAGSRVFDVSIEGTEVLTNYDIFVAAPGAAMATTTTHNVTVSDGNITIVLSDDVDNAKISGIEIFAVTDGEENGEENGTEE